MLLGVRHTLAQIQEDNLTVEFAALGRLSCVADKLAEAGMTSAASQECESLS